MFDADKVSVEREVKIFGKVVSKKLCLIVASELVAIGMQRDWAEEGSLVGGDNVMTQALEKNTRKWITQLRKVFVFEAVDEVAETGVFEFWGHQAGLEGRTFGKLLWFGSKWNTE